MRNKILMSAVAALALTTAGMASGVAVAQVKPSQFEKDSKIKDPAAANVAVAKDEAKDAKKEHKTAHKKAKAAASKAKTAAKKADDAAKSAPSQ